MYVVNLRRNVTMDLRLNALIQLAILFGNPANSLTLCQLLLFELDFTLKLIVVYLIKNVLENLKRLQNVEEHENVCPSKTKCASHFRMERLCDIGRSAIICRTNTPHLQNSGIVFI